MEFLSAMVMSSQQSRHRRDTTSAAGPVEVSVGAQGSVRVSARDDTAVVRVTHAATARPLELEITFTAEGVVVRTRADALELDTPGRVHARCASFEVDAQEDIALRAQGAFSVRARAVDVEATHEGASIRANDDVQLLGEHVLLNCDPSPPMPEWVPVAPSPPAAPATLPRADASGDAALLAAIRGGA